jgi:lipoprotein signal peptidase
MYSSLARCSERALSRNIGIVFSSTEGMSYPVMIVSALVVGSLIWLINSFTPERLKPALTFVMVIVLVIWGLHTAGMLPNIIN